MIRFPSFQRVRFPRRVLFCAAFFVVSAGGTLVAQEDQPSNVADPAVDSHGDTFDGVKIIALEKKFDNGVNSSFIEGFRGADGKFVRHGWSITYYSNGHKRTKTLWRNGVPDGIRLTWYLTGQLWTRGRYVQGKEDGLWVRWHENGQKFSERPMRMGAWHGVYTEWHSNGKKKSEVEFIDGLRQGPMYLYDDQGVLVARTDYVDGVEQP